jgi:hypothetical protein
MCKYPTTIWTSAKYKEPVSPTSIAGSIAGDTESLATVSIADSEVSTFKAKHKKAKVAGIDSDSENEKPAKKRVKKDPIQTARNLLVKYAFIFYYNDNTQE